MVYKNNKTFLVPVELANFDPAIHTSVLPEWAIKDNGRVLFKGKLAAKSNTTGNAILPGAISQSLAAVREPKKLVLAIRVGKYENEWDFFVYPDGLPSTSSDMYVTKNLDEKAIATLNDGGKVLLPFPKNAIGRNRGRDIAVGFSSIFWNTARTNGQAPHTLGTPRFSTFQPTIIATGNGGMQ